MESLKPGDALLIADVQNDFLPGGALGISGGDDILPVLMNYMHRFEVKGLPIFLTRDWHPSNHCSFHEQGGSWPAHCIAGSHGSLPPPSFHAPSSVVLIYKAVGANQEAYSAFEGTPLQRLLHALRISRLFVGGLATDYCVLHTVEDARRLGYEVCLLTDGIRAVNVHPEDGRQAETHMLQLGAVPLHLEALAA